MSRLFLRRMLLSLMLACLTLTGELRRVMAEGPTVELWLTTPDLQARLTKQPSLSFSSDAETDQTPSIDVDETTRLQEMDGFGVAVTDSSASLMYTSLSDAQRDVLLRSLFDPSDGIHLSVVRIPMGASDFTASGFYSYDDLPSPQTDPALEHFSIAHDDTRIVPILQRAIALNPSLKLIANPWSPPAWMKSNATMLGSTGGLGGRLTPAFSGSLAQYFVKFIQNYQERGLPIYAITPQNEPLYAPLNYPGMLMSVSEQMSFINEDLSPALAHANVHAKILAYDFNWDNVSYARVLLHDPTTASNVAGIAWHCYAGNPTAMSTIHAEFPTKEIHETECSPSSTAMSTIDLLFGSVQNWARTVLLWNAALDPDYGPHVGGCDNCAPLVVIAASGGSVTYPLEYYEVGHFSKFVGPGAVHVSATTADSPNAVAFQTPHGTLVVVAHNGGNADSAFKVRWNGQSFNYVLAPNATATFTWPAFSSE